MRYTYLLLFLIIATTGKSQTITMYKTFGGVRFERDSLVISAKQTHDIISEDPIAFEQFRKARTNSAVASVLGFAGGLLIGIPVGTALIGGGDPEWGLALGGAALIGISIPFNRAFQRNAQSALDSYNSKTSSRRGSQTEVFLAGAGAGIRIKF